jgi:hypothetical protein
VGRGQGSGRSTDESETAADDHRCASPLRATARPNRHRSAPTGRTERNGRPGSGRPEDWPLRRRAAQVCRSPRTAGRRPDRLRLHAGTRAAPATLKQSGGGPPSVRIAALRGRGTTLSNEGSWGGGWGQGCITCVHHLSCLVPGCQGARCQSAAKGAKVPRCGPKVPSGQVPGDAANAGQVARARRTSHEHVARRT